MKDVSYIEDDSCCIAEFPTEWIGTRLPSQTEFSPNWPITRPSFPFLATIEDNRDGNRYTTKLYAWYEFSLGTNSVLSPSDDRSVVQAYKYRHHYCQCHRASSVERQGADCSEFALNYCGGGRFVIESIVAEQMPELILYSETFGIEELEQKLHEKEQIDD